MNLSEKWIELTQLVAMTLCVNCDISLFRFWQCSVRHILTVLDTDWQVSSLTLTTFFVLSFLVYLFEWDLFVWSRLDVTTIQFRQNPRVIIIWLFVVSVTLCCICTHELTSMISLCLILLFLNCKLAFWAGMSFFSFSLI